jgi:hypothetical protein
MCAAFTIETFIRAGELREYSGVLRPRTGDFFHFYEACVAMSRDQDIYQSGTGGYIYPPLLAWAFQPFAMVDETSAARIWIIFNASLLILSVTLIASCFGDLIPGRFGKASAAIAATVGVALLGDKLRSELVLGQTDGFLLLAHALALKYADRRPGAVGVLLGLAANIKYLPLLMLPYLLFRRRWLIATMMPVGFIIGLWIPALSVGVEQNSRYVQVAVNGLCSMAGVPAAFPALQDVGANIFSVNWIRSISITSACARIWGTSAINAKVAVSVLVIASACLFLAIRIYRKNGLRFICPIPVPPPSIASRTLFHVEWCCLLPAILLFSPQTTTRHMVMALCLTIMAGWLMVTLVSRTERRIVLGASLLFAFGMVFPPGGDDSSVLLERWRFLSVAGWLALPLLLICLGFGIAQVSRNRHAPESNSGA